MQITDSRALFLKWAESVGLDADEQQYSWFGWRAGWSARSRIIPEREEVAINQPELAKNRSNVTEREDSPPDEGTCYDCTGLREDLEQLIRVCLTNPGDIRGFIEANYPKEFQRYAGDESIRKDEQRGNPDCLADGLSPSPAPVMGGRVEPRAAFSAASPTTDQPPLHFPDCSIYDDSGTELPNGKCDCGGAVEDKPTPRWRDEVVNNQRPDESCVSDEFLEGIINEHDMNVPDGLLASPGGYGAHREAMRAALDKMLPLTRHIEAEYQKTIRELKRESFALPYTRNELFKRLCKLGTPINMLIGASRSVSGMDKSHGVRTEWVDSLLRHADQAREAWDAIIAMFDDEHVTRGADNG